MSAPTLRGSVTLGRFTLLEDFTVTEGDDRTLKLALQAGRASWSNSQIERRYHDLLGLASQLIPVTFTEKPFLDGFYRVTSVAASYSAYPGTTRQVQFDGDLTLQRVGSDNTVDIESRLSGTRTRPNDFAAVGDIWHAPPVGHIGYQVQASTLGFVGRESADGTVLVYRGLDFGSCPRWGCALADFGGGRVRFADASGEERSATGLPMAATTLTGGLFPSDDLYPDDELYPDPGTAAIASWSISNGLVKVEPLATGGLFQVSTYSGGDWHPTAWDVTLNGGTIAPLTTSDVLWNSYHTVVVRIMSALSPGRVTVDLLLRRGSRFVEVFVQSTTSATIGFRRGLPDTATAGTGYVTDDSNDANGNRWIVGSARTFTADTTNGGLARAGAVELDAFVGAVVGGTAAQVGDTAADLFAQYLGSPTEQQIGIRR